MDYIYDIIRPYIKKIRREYVKTLYHIDILQGFKKNRIKNIRLIKRNLGKDKQPMWVEIWNIDTFITSLEDKKGLPWNLYFKYKLSMIKSWHILEERFLVLFLILLICFF